ncbi:IclR family transcriptional regulator [Halobellus rufus]|uniref:IclR family transcriptional regulator n=1 Tax=Halobellus rufus TaxID=1448860 RepID=UPI00067890B6|nr:IclR family transcriptional regulator [Halobellus rufus]
MDERGQTENTLAGVEKTFDVIAAVQELGRVRVTELADHLDIPPSTAQVHLNTLRKCGYVIKDDGKYKIGLRFLEHGGYARRQLDLYRAAKTHINDLAEQTGEAANLGVEENGERVLIYKSESPNDAIYDNAPTGERTHLHWTALGKALLAELPDTRIETIVESHGLPAKTPHTITDREALFEEIEAIRKRGYSIEDQDRRKGILAIGVPIIEEQTDSVAGAICVSGPRSRFWDDGIDKSLLDAVKNTANIVELQYNHYVGDGS